MLSWEPASFQHPQQAVQTLTPKRYLPIAVRAGCFLVLWGLATHSFAPYPPVQPPGGSEQALPTSHLRATQDFGTVSLLCIY